MIKLVFSGAPHIHGDEHVKKIMWGVVLALLPAFLVSIYFFGLSALLSILLSVASCVFFEYIIQKFLLKKPVSITDGSAVITGLLLAFNLPSNLPYWMIIIGAIVAIGIAKMAFGGLGNNPFNPALVARAFLLISFPVAMTTWPVAEPFFASGGLDALTGPTPFGFAKEALAAGTPMNEVMSQINLQHLAIGNRGGSLGEVSAIALLLGGAFMLYKKIIRWHIPVAFIGSAFIFAAILWGIDPAQYLNPVFHIFSGGLILGAIFMATDMVTSPMTAGGMLIFGAGCGLITILIRSFGAYPEGVSFAILIMNAFVPLLNRAFPPKRFAK